MLWFFRLWLATPTTMPNNCPLDFCHHRTEEMKGALQPPLSPGTLPGLWDTNQWSPPRSFWEMPCLLVKGFLVPLPDCLAWMCHTLLATMSQQGQSGRDGVRTDSRREGVWGCLRVSEDVWGCLRTIPEPASLCSCWLKEAKPHVQALRAEFSVASGCSHLRPCGSLLLPNR